MSMNQDSKWLIFGLVCIIAAAALFGWVNQTITTNNTERDRIRAAVGLIGPFEGTCMVNSVGSAFVLTCKLGLDPFETE